MRWIIYILIVFSLNSCKEDSVFTPKPRMYPRVDYPQKKYTNLKGIDCDFRFEAPYYAKYKKDTTRDESGNVYDCWFDMAMEPFNAEINFSYHPISKKTSLDRLLADAFKMTDKHNIKADYIEEELIKNPYGVSGLKFKLYGPVASPIQFFVTDSTQHFLRGSLYFNSKVNQDSLAPILNYVEEDINHLIQSFQWVDME